MMYENLNESISPDDSGELNENQDQDTDTTEDFDVLPSNGPGLAGDDGEQVVDADNALDEDIDIEDDDDELDEEDDDDDDEDEDSNV